MPSEWQLIDGFERLREQFAREHPAFQDQPRERPATTSPEVWIAEAWVQAIEGRAAASAAQARRVRALARAVLASDAGPDRESARLLAAHDGALARLTRGGRGFPRCLDLARQRQLPPLAGPAPPQRSTAETLAAWRGVLPGLAGLRGWRFIERLGHPVVVPEAPLRRFLWRLGLVEPAPGERDADQRAQAAIESLMALTGLSAVWLAVLVGWLTRPHEAGHLDDAPEGHLDDARESARDEAPDCASDGACVRERDHAAGGQAADAAGACALRPRCPRCPFRPGCAWARFQAATPSRPHAAARRSLEPVHHLIASGRTEQMHEIELLAALLQRGTPELGPFELAESVLRRGGGLRGLDRSPVAELERLHGLSRGRALQIKAALELGRRLAARALAPGDPIRCSDDIWQAYRGRFRHLPQEHFVVVLLDAKNRVIHDVIVSKGSLTGSLAHPREVFQEAVRQSAAGVILMHNHPSGDPRPSRDDKAVTTRLVESGEILGIKVLDHIILGSEDFYSFKDEGEI